MKDAYHLNSKSSILSKCLTLKVDKGISLAIAVAAINISLNSIILFFAKPLIIFSV